MRTIKIESLGVYLPERTVSTKEVIKSCKKKIWFPMERLTGIKSRQVVGENEFSIDLARRSISRCLDLSKYCPKDIDLLICCNISRYDKPAHFSIEPSTALELKRDFGFENALCFDISNACAGMFTAIHIVDGFVKSGLAKCALVVSGEYITHLMETAQKEISGRKDDPRLACLTLGDSGAAIILEESKSEQPGFHNIEMFTLGEYSNLCLAGPTTEPHGGFIMNTQALKLQQIAIQEGTKLVVNSLKSRAQQFPVNYFLPHQTARTALKQGIKDVNDALGIPLLNSYNTIINLEHRGNTSTTSHFVALLDKIQDSTINSKDTVFFVIQASGITLGVAEYTLDDLPDRIRNHEKPAKWVGGMTSENGVQPEKRIAISALGTALPTGDCMADSIVLMTNAIQSCLKGDGQIPREVGLLINTSVYQSLFLGEPAIASIIAGRMQLNSTVEDWGHARTLAYDLANGGCGFLLGCRNAQAMIAAGITKKALCVSSEIDNNKTLEPNDILGLKESGCASLLEESSRVGFCRFLFKHYPEYQEVYRTGMCIERGSLFLQIIRNPEWESPIIKHAGDVIEALLAEEKLTMRDIQVIIPPQISGAFVRRFTRQLNLPESKVVNLNDSQNYHTCSTVFGLKDALERGMVQEGDRGLIVEAGSGLMVAVALYQF